uniref:Kunitz-type serine protease inhibitor 2 n=1 Tax=Daboia russelii TaxID=8707 RepID=VKT2_DABRR|nr:RecName: Full=Kunitz-type serine protease inhibitor 2; AltName: Full=Kunitz protease inhibitor 2; AltName: Full=Kunitz protease inhibitor II; Flags: Precursor [Daboia russelii]ABD24041.1 Kunitz protease inhibitor-II [Daboia russelii russelii]
MSSGGLLLLLGLLTLWAEPTPISGQDRPKFCFLRPDFGRYGHPRPRFYYNPATNQCQGFLAQRSRENTNNFDTRDKCRQTCGRK